MTLLKIGAISIDYGLLPPDLSEPGKAWFHIARSAVFAFALFFMWAAVGAITGLAGCWRASGSRVGQIVQKL